jgi:hypothetical protein
MNDMGAALDGGTPGGKEWKAADAASFIQAIGEINAAGNGEYTIILTGSFPADPVSFSGGAAKTITLKGKAGKRIISNTGDKPLFTVPGAITLVLNNNLILDGSKKQTRLVMLEGGVLIMKGGAALRGSADGGVMVGPGSSFTMNGGTISGNSASRGGGVYIDRGSLTMNGGTIGGNSANGDYSGGGGVYVDSGNFTMSGGTISGNSANGDYSGGGGVYVDNGSFTMIGGTIGGNSANGDYSGGGGAFVHDSGSFIMIGGTISGNSASRGGGGVRVADGSFSMSEGGISGNSTGGSGGGVFVIGGSFSMSGGIFSGNSADSYGGSVFVFGNSRFVKIGGTADGTNTAQEGRVACVWDENREWVRNSAAGPEATLDSMIDGSPGGWEY